MYYNQVYTQLSEEDRKDITQKAEGSQILINLVDSAGHVDFTSEVTAALHVTDGALLVVNFVDGVCVRIETVACPAFSERIKPVCIIPKVTRALLELQVSKEDLYYCCSGAIETVNVIAATCLTRFLVMPEFIVTREQLPLVQVFTVGLSLSANSPDAMPRSLGLTRTR